MSGLDWFHSQASPLLILCSIFCNFTDYYSDDHSDNILISEILNTYSNEKEKCKYGNNHFSRFDS